MLILSDLVNALICLLVIIISVRMKIIPNWIAFVLGFYSFIPFLLNDFLFPAKYMADQFLYSETLEEVRSFNYFFPGHSYLSNPKSLYTVWFLSLLPLPFAETVKSMGFFNRFLFLIMFIWLYRKNFLSGIPLNFLIFYPSLVLYTSLSLREPFTLFLMLSSTIFFIDKKYFRSILLLFPLFFIKNQNFLLMIIFYSLLLLYRKKALLYRYRYFVIFFIFSYFIYFFQDIILMMERIRSSFFVQDGGDLQFYKSLKETKSFIIAVATSSSYFLMKPFPWEANGIFQQIQSIENIFILLVLIIFTKRAYNQDSSITLTWLFFLILSLTAYGLIVFNYGSAVRYKYPFIVLYVVGLSYELYKLHGYRFGSIFKIKM